MFKIDKSQCGPEAMLWVIMQGPVSCKLLRVIRTEILWLSILTMKNTAENQTFDTKKCILWKSIKHSVCNSQSHLISMLIRSGIKIRPILQNFAKIYKIKNFELYVCPLRIAIYIFLWNTNYIDSISFSKILYLFRNFLIDYL